jgi:hypothetical protein
MKVVFLVFTPSRRRMACRDIAWVAEHGAQPVLVTVGFESWPEIDARTEVIDLSERESRQLLPRAQRVVLFRMPRLTFRLLAALLRRIGRVPVAGRYARSLLLRIPAAVKRSDKAARAIRRRAYQPAYNHLRPYLLWRLARRTVVPELALQPGDQVVVGDTVAISLGWHIARRHPDVRVVFSLDRTAFTEGRDEPTPVSA